MSHLKFKSKGLRSFIPPYQTRKYLQLHHKTQYLNLFLTKCTVNVKNRHTKDKINILLTYLGYSLSLSLSLSLSRSYLPLSGNYADSEWAFLKIKIDAYNAIYTHTCIYFLEPHQK